MIETRHRAPAEWEPVSLTLGPNRTYHYATREWAQQALDTFLESDAGLPQLIARLAAGQPKIAEMLEFRIVEVRAIEADRLVIETEGNVGIGGPGGG
jgi:hypothetical protein